MGLRDTMAATSGKMLKSDDSVLDVATLLAALQTSLELIDNAVSGAALAITAAQLPAALAAGGGLKVEGVAGGVAQPVSATALPLPTGAATSALQGGGLPAALAAGGGLKIEGVSGGVVVPTQVSAVPTGGCSIFRSIDLDESEEEVKGSAGTLYAIHAMNIKASVLYLKVYDGTAATVVVGTTVPVMTFPLPTPGNTNGAGFVWDMVPQGALFASGITVACTTGIADADVGAPGNNECIVNILYK